MHNPPVAAEPAAVTVEPAADPDPLRCAEQSLAAAREQLRQAEAAFRQARSAAALPAAAGEVKVGEALDAAFEFVRQHPGPSLLAAVVAGVLLGRLFDR